MIKKRQGNAEALYMRYQLKVCVNDHSIYALRIETVLDIIDRLTFKKILYIFSNNID